MGLKVFQRCDPKLLRRTALGSALPPNMIGHAIPPLEIQSTTLAIVTLLEGKCEQSLNDFFVDQSQQVARQRKG